MNHREVKGLICVIGTLLKVHDGSLFPFLAYWQFIFSFLYVC